MFLLLKVLRNNHRCEVPLSLVVSRVHTVNMTYFEHLANVVFVSFFNCEVIHLPLYPYLEGCQYV